MLQLRWFPASFKWTFHMASYLIYMLILDYALECLTNHVQGPPLVKYTFSRGKGEREDEVNRVGSKWVVVVLKNRGTQGFLRPKDDSSNPRKDKPSFLHYLSMGPENQALFLPGPTFCSTHAQVTGHIDPPIATADKASSIPRRLTFVYYGVIFLFQLHVYHLFSLCTCTYFMSLLTVFEICRVRISQKERKRSKCVVRV